MDTDDGMDLFDFSKPFEPKVHHRAAQPALLNARHFLELLPGTGHRKEGLWNAEKTSLMRAFCAAAAEKLEKSRLDKVETKVDDDKEHVPEIREKEVTEPEDAPHNASTRLSIHSSKAEILKSIRRNPIVVLEGRTGCGKTTQVPQYLLEEAAQRKAHCNIVVTQPRKIAAISIAKRVAKECSCKLGSLVGFKVGLKEMLSPDTKITYVTTGVLLQWLLNAETMKRFTHIILDEVHEREADMDFLLIIVRHMLAMNESNPKVILMSATINGMEFSNYFKTPGPNGRLAPILSVASKSQYVVREMYLNDIDPQLTANITIDYKAPGICSEMFTLAGALAFNCDREIDGPSANAASPIDYKPSIIMFLPGVSEIDQMAEELKNRIDNQGPLAVRTEFTVLKLHSLLTPDEQALVFVKPPPGHRKVILSTNIAESSITIPDIKYVIDFCLQRIIVADTEKNFTSLRTQWASKTNCIQRSGRVGRVMDGYVYRLVDKHYFDKGMKESTEPEMVRCPLGMMVLNAKQVNFAGPNQVLNMAMSPPNLADIANTVLQLKEMGALRRTAKGKYCSLDGDLTQLGVLISQLPLELHLSKLIVLGYLYTVLDESIIIAAGMNVKNIFNQLRTVKAYEQKLRWADGSGSDGIAILIAYTTWRRMLEQGTGGNEAEWCSRAQLDRKSLLEMAELVQEIKLRLEHANVRAMSGAKRVFWSDREKILVLKVVMAGAFYPHYFCTLPLADGELGERDVYMPMGDRDPFSTVYLTGFDHRNYIGSLYREQIKQFMSGGDRTKHDTMEVDFEKTSNKVYVRFTHPCRANELPDRIHAGVYSAVKLRQLKRAVNLSVMSLEDQIRFAVDHELGTWQDGGWHPRRIAVPNVHQSVVPRVHTHRLRACVTHVEHPGKFFLCPLEVPVEHSLEVIDQQLNGSGISLAGFPPSHQFKKHQIVAALLPHSSKQFGRAQLLREQGGTGDWAVDFLDHGCTAVLPIGAMRQLTGDVTMVPRRVFQATLAEVQSGGVHSPTGFWTADSIRWFTRLVSGRELQVEIYSVVNQVASVILRHSEDPDEQTINERLVECRDAQPSEEPYPSKRNHQTRTRIQREISINPAYGTIIEQDESDLEHYVDDDELHVPLPPDLLTSTLTLYGPYSTLQVSCRSMVASCFQKSVSFETESINSVLLDPCPQETHGKMLVAASVNQSSKHKLVARQTTMMPNIPGMALLMALLFAPACSFKTNPEQTRVTGLVAGHGLHPKYNVPIYPEHDLSLPADVDIANDDIIDINALRFAMDWILNCLRIDDPELFDENKIAGYMLKIKENLFRLLGRERTVYSTNADTTTEDFLWTKGTEDELGQRTPTTTPNNYNTSIFSLHNFPELPVRDEILLQNFQELHSMANDFSPFPDDGICCLLCMQMLETKDMLQTHMLKQLHIRNETRINFPELT